MGVHKGNMAPHRCPSPSSALAVFLPLLILNHWAAVPRSLFVMLPARSRGGLETERRRCAPRIGVSAALKTILVSRAAAAQLAVPGVVAVAAVGDRQCLHRWSFVRKSCTATPLLRGSLFRASTAAKNLEDEGREEGGAEEEEEGEEDEWYKLRLYGPDALGALKSSHVCVVGVGGVGSWTVEALARTGVGTLTLIDLDDICVSNVNRQLHALQSTVGKQKVDVLAARAKEINPSICIHAVSEFFTNMTAESLLGPIHHPKRWISLLVDAIDSVPHKADLLYHARIRQIPTITVGGAGGRTDPTQISTSDLASVTHDPLLKAVKRQLKTLYPKEFREEGGRVEGREKRRGSRKQGAAEWGIPCIYTKEKGYHPMAKSNENNKGLRLDCASGYGTATHVTGFCGEKERERERHTERELSGRWNLHLGAFGFTAAAVASQILASRGQDALKQQQRPLEEEHAGKMAEGEGGGEEKPQSDEGKGEEDAAKSFFDSHCHLQLDRKLIDYLETTPGSGVGECGLDKAFAKKYPGHAGMEIQKAVLKTHIGSPEMANTFIKANEACYFSFSGAASKIHGHDENENDDDDDGDGKGIRKLKAWERVLSCIPKERLLLETDSPDQPLVTARDGVVNTPEAVADVGAIVADCLAMHIDDVARLTTGNARRVFLDPGS
eukprot:jgi/Bigna1/143320/aug1.77_g18028